MRQIAVIGLGKFGCTVAKELVKLGAQVIAVDQNRQRVEEIKESVTYAAALNSMDESALKALGIQNVDIAVVCVGEDVEANLLTTLLLKRMGIKKIWARAINPLQQEVLKALAVDSIINLEEEMGKLVARSMASENVTKHIHLSPGYSVSEIKMPQAFIGKTLRQINARQAFEINVVAVKKMVPSVTDFGERKLEEYTENVPTPDTELAENDILVVVGNDQNIERFSRA